MLRPHRFFWLLSVLLVGVQAMGADCTTSLASSTWPPLTKQTTDYTCGPSSLLCWLKAQSLDNHTEDSLALVLNTDQEFGTSYVDFIEGIRNLGFEANFLEDLSIPDLQKYLSLGYGVIVSSQLEDTGHWSLLVEISPDSKSLVLMDPWLADQGYRVIDNNLFYQDWYDYFGKPMEYHQRAAIVIKPVDASEVPIEVSGRIVL